MTPDCQDTVLKAICKVQQNAWCLWNMIADPRGPELCISQTLHDLHAEGVLSGVLCTHNQLCSHASLSAQELAKEPALVTLLLKGPLLKYLAKSLLSPTDQLVQHAAMLLQYMALNAQPDQLPAAEVKAVMSSLAQYSLSSDNWLLRTAVGSAACSLPPALLLPDVKPPLPSPPKTPPPPPLPLSKFIWDAMDYEKSSPKQFAVA